MIQPETTREGIRELKQFNKTEPEAGEADDIRELVEKFYQDNPEILNEVFGEAAAAMDIRQLAEIVNPGGNRSYRKGMYFLMMYENKLSVKKFGSQPQEMTWEEFFQVTRDIFGEAAAGSRTWENYFGTEETDKTEETEQSVRSADDENAPALVSTRAGGHLEDAKTEENALHKDVKEVESDFPEEKTGEEEEKEAVAPAQKVQETAEVLGEEAAAGPEPDQEKTVEEQGFETAMNEPENLKKPYGSRKEYFDTLITYGMASELAVLVKNMLNSNLADMTETTFWERWLDEEVDDHGRTIEEV